MATFKLQSNYDRKQHSNNDISMAIHGSSSNQIINNDSLIENLRVLVKEYLEIVNLDYIEAYNRCFHKFLKFQSVTAFRFERSYTFLTVQRFKGSTCLNVPLAFSIVCEFFRTLRNGQERCMILTVHAGHDERSGTFTKLRYRLRSKTEESLNIF
jgi:hypothetical protein